jgi:hypothetical protein
MGAVCQQEANIGSTKAVRYVIVAGVLRVYNKVSLFVHTPYRETPIDERKPVNVCRCKGRH